MRTTWIVGRRSGIRGWRVVGAYTRRREAILACQDYRDFILPKLQNQTVEEGREWQGMFWPIPKP
jgi:hypothetical protein